MIDNYGCSIKTKRINWMIRDHCLQFQNKELTTTYILEVQQKGQIRFCETQMPQIMPNSKDGQDYKDKYLDTSRKILSQEMLMCNMKALIFINYWQQLRPMSIFFKRVKRSKGLLPTVQHSLLLARLQFSKKGQTPRSRSQGKK